MGLEIGILVLAFVLALVMSLGVFKAEAQLKATASSHSVTLSCVPSTTTSVTGYYFYRGTVSGQEGVTAISPMEATCGYVDTTVSPLTTYFYTAKAFSPLSAPPGLSVSSNETSVAVPGDPAPNPPTNVSATAQ